MKISSDKPGMPSGGADPVTGTPATTSQATDRSKPATAGDQLTLSPEAHMLRAAQEAASQGDPVRPEVVARMRELLEKGELGTDASKLADAIIDNWLHSI